MIVLNDSMQEVYDRQPQPRTDLQKAETRLTRQYGTCETHKRQKKKCTCNIPEHERVWLPTLAPNEDDHHAADERDAPIDSTNQAVWQTEYLLRYIPAINTDEQPWSLRQLSQHFLARQHYLLSRLTSDEARAIRMCRLSKDASTYEDTLTLLSAHSPSYSRVMSELETWERVFEQEEVDAREACAALHDIDMENFLALARRIKQNSLAGPPERDRSPPSKYCEDLLAQSGFQSEIWEHGCFTYGIVAQLAASWYQFIFQSIMALAMLKLLRPVFGHFFHQIYSTLLGTTALAWKITFS